MDAADAADKVIGAYNAEDYDAMDRLIAEDVRFSHHNRDIVHDNRSALMAMLRASGEVMASRHYEPPERVTAAGGVCVRESEWTATLKAGETMQLRLCTVMRFDEAGTLVEWSDYG